MSDRDSLTQALELWFDEPLCELPDEVSRRIEKEFFPLSWDSLSADQRRSAARQADCQQDPASAKIAKTGFDEFVRKSEIEDEIAHWEVIPVLSASDLALKEDRLEALRSERDQLAIQLNRAHRSKTPGKVPHLETTNWMLAVQMEAARRWLDLRKGGATPTKHALRDVLSKWCRDNGVKTSTGGYPTGDYIYRFALRKWHPPEG